MMKASLMTFGVLAAVGWLPAEAQLQSCPTSDIQSSTSSCYLLTPAQAGADSSGDNATEPSLILTPSSAVTPRGVLLLYLNGSNAHPEELIASPTQNFYLTAANLGYNVIALSYASDDTIATLCEGVAQCYYPSRQTIITGVYQSGAASQLDDITPSEGIIERLIMTLQTLAQDYPTQGWGNFLTTGTGGMPNINWSQVFVAGHSQGGGNAAAIAKMYQVVGVIQLSSTCDETNNNTTDQNAIPAPWLFAPTSGTSGWATDPNTFWGLDIAAYFNSDGSATCPSDNQACGDEICFDHAKAWQALGMAAAYQNDNEYLCPLATNSDGTVTDPALQVHDMSIDCAENYPFWLQMLQNASSSWASRPASR